MRTNLISPGPIQVFRLEEAFESSISSVYERGLVIAKQILPKSRSSFVLLSIIHLSEATGHLCNSEVIIRVFQRAGDAPRHRSKTLVVKILYWNVVQRFPTVQATTSFIRPVIRLLFSILLDGGVASLPVYSVGNALEVRIGKDDVRV